jgi:hypothetical protein
MRRIEGKVTGGCQCGAVRYRASAMLDNAHLCHCRMCQKAVGGLFAALVAAPNDAIEWTRRQPATWRSSDHVDRGFCAACGSPLFYRNLQGSRTNFTIGSLDRPQDFPPRAQMGSEARIPWFGDLSTLPDEGVTGAGGNEAWAEAIAASNRQHPDHDTSNWPTG